MNRWLRQFVNRWLRQFAIVAAIVALVAPVAANAAVKSELSPLEDKIRHELVMLPWYGLFDSLKFQVVDGRVTLLGQVTRPTLKSDAENVVKRIEGVESVDNQIEVLPLSRFDDQIRVGVARAIFGYGGMYRYGMGAQSAIRILVKNGHVTLEGVVGSEMDRNIANIRANGVFGVFGVTNNLNVAGKEA